MDLSDLFYVLSGMLKVETCEETPLNCTQNVEMIFKHFEQTDVHDRVKGIFVKEIATRVNEFLLDDNEKNLMLGYRHIKPLCMVDECITGELMEILEKLPKMSNDTKYVFPRDTYISFDKQVDGKIVVTSSDNVKEKLEERVGKMQMCNQTFLKF